VKRHGPEKENMSESDAAPPAADISSDPAPQPDTSREPGSIRERMEEIADRIEKREAGEVEDKPDSETPDAEPKPAAVRDPSGKFAQKNPPAEPKPDAKAPDWLTGKAAVDWNRLPPSVREALAAAVPPAPAAPAPVTPQQQAPDPIRDVVAQYADHFTSRGIAPEHGVASLLQTYRQLEQNPAETLRFLAEQYRVPWGGEQSPNQHARQQPMASQDGQPYQQPDIESHPTVAALRQQLAMLEQGYGTVQQRIASQDRENAARRVHEAQLLIEKFANDPTNPRPHFETVKEDMARLMNARLATDIADAYDKAAWANPTIRATMMAEAQAKAAEEAAKAAREREAAARRAAIINARTTGTTGVSSNSRGSIRETMERVASTIE
jgi:hypothetical protein